VPELCKVTGDLDRKNQLLAIEVANLTKPDMSTKLIDIKRYFFDNLQAQLEKANDQLASEIGISNIPIILDGY